MSYFNPQTWRRFTREEQLDYLDTLGKHDRGGEGAGRGDILVVQNLVSPLDLYTYLKARFGEPNGMQTFLRNDDSDNMFHWDYYLKAGDRRLIFIGATQEVHIWTQDCLTDAEWFELIGNLKLDFGRVGKEKKAVLEGLERWSIFPNHFLSVAGRCADSYDKLRESLDALSSDTPKFRFSPDDPKFKSKAKKDSALLTNITAAATDLSILTPIMFESFLGLLIACFVKPEVKKNDRLYLAFLRGQLDVKLFDLHNRCNGFSRPIEPNNSVMRRYWNAVNRRNDIIHGNVDPIKNSLDVVYFDKKVPLFRSGGDRIRSFRESLLDQHKPHTVLEDYLTAHEFIYEIADHMMPEFRESLFVVMDDSQPGFDEKRNELGRLFPGHVTSFYLPGLRYDYELKADKETSA